MTTRIEWTDETWNPMTGCTPVSEACEHCYAERISRRFYAGSNPRAHFAPRFLPDRLDIPLHWRKPRRVFVCSMSDFFHEAFSDEQRDCVLQTINQAPQHTYMLLTKRPEQMRRYVRRLAVFFACKVWLGVTAENQARADERLPILLNTPARLRFVSLEPLLGPVDLRLGRNLIDWVIVGGETGPGARRMEQEWALDVWQQCKDAGVPFFWKREGDWAKRHRENSAIAWSLMTSTRRFPRAVA